MGWKDNSGANGGGGIFFQSSNKTIFASGNQLASAVQTSSDLTDVPAPQRHRGLIVVVDVTVNAGGLGSVTVKINGKDPASGKYYTILQSTALSAVATTVLRIYPTLTASANLIAQDILPETIQIVATGGSGGPITYSVGSIQVV